MFHCNILQRATAARSTTMLCWVLAACICAVSSFSVPATLRPAYTIVRRSVLDARCSAETEVWNRIPRRAQLAAWATSIITIAGNRAEAKQGDIPKFKGLGEITNEYVEDAIDRRKVGLYDENAKAEVIQRSKKVTKDFNKMSKEVDAGKPSPLPTHAERRLELTECMLLQHWLKDDARTLWLRSACAWAQSRVRCVSSQELRRGATFWSAGLKEKRLSSTSMTGPSSTRRLRSCLRTCLLPSTERLDSARRRTWRSLGRSGRQRKRFTQSGPHCWSRCEGERDVGIGEGWSRGGEDEEDAKRRRAAQRGGEERRKGGEGRGGGGKEGNGSGWGGEEGERRGWEGRGGEKQQQSHRGSHQVNGRGSHLVNGSDSNERKRLCSLRLSQACFNQGFASRFSFAFL